MGPGETLGYPIVSRTVADCAIMAFVACLRRFPNSSRLSFLCAQTGCVAAMAGSCDKEEEEEQAFLEECGLLDLSCEHWDKPNPTKPNQTNPINKPTEPDRCTDGTRANQTHCFESTMLRLSNKTRRGNQPIPNQHGSSGGESWTHGLWPMKCQSWPLADCCVMSAHLCNRKPIGWDAKTMHVAASA